jgi:hypothetical protein
MKNNAQIDLAYDFIKEPDPGSYEYVYRGTFNEGITNNILKLTESKLSSRETTRSLRKRISFIIIENLQNISRHQDIPNDESMASNCLFVLHINHKAARVLTGNFVENSKKAVLREKLDRIVSMDGDEMKALYKEILCDSKISKKGGAGLGLISMGRRTGGNIHYRFVDVDSDHSFFYLQNELFISDDADPKEEQAFFEQMIDHHRLLEKENILLNFRGAFAFDNVEVLLPVINTQTIGGYGQKRLIYNISVNLIRNIILYAEPEKAAGYFPDEEEAREEAPGVYTLSKQGNNTVITSGNYISNDKILTLKNKLELINKTGTEGLLKIRDYLNNFYPEEHVGRPDISLIDMKLNNSDREIAYNFVQVDENRSFFTIQIRI